MMCQVDASLPMQKKRPSNDHMSSSDSADEDIPLEISVQRCAEGLEELIVDDDTWAPVDEEVERVCLSLMCLKPLMKHMYRLF